MSVTSPTLKTFVAERLLARNEPSRVFFECEAERLAEACDEMSERFLDGGRLLAFGRGASSTDAQHVAVEFVHPVIVGKRALPALDLSLAFEHSIRTIARSRDIAMGFAGPEPDPAVTLALADAQARGAQTFALSGVSGDFAVASASAEPFINQEIVEILYHTLWETVHVFLEHHERGHDDVGESAFLYPFLGGERQDTSAVRADVATSICAKARDDERLREHVARDQGDQIAEVAIAVRRRLETGAALLMFGNGGSATDANDWAIDCATAPIGHVAIPAVSLSADPATLTAIANDIGTDAMFLRQIIAHGRQGDVAIGISTSGSSASIIAGLREARKRGMLTVALLGYDGGEIVRSGLADLPVVVRCDYIPRIQEVQASIYHVLTEAWQQWPA